MTSARVSIQWRADKVGYAAPLDLWLRGELMEWGRAPLRRPDPTLEQYDAKRIGADWKRHQSGGADNSWPLWRWISLNDWLALFAEQAWSRGA